MWYEDSVPETTNVQYDKPIVAEKDDRKYLLLPVVDNAYNLLGYDWFNIIDGNWNSVKRWKDPHDAVACYFNSGHDVYNDTFGV